MPARNTPVERGVWYGEYGSTKGSCSNPFTLPGGKLPSFQAKLVLFHRIWEGHWAERSLSGGEAQDSRVDASDVGYQLPGTIPKQQFT